MTLAEQTGYGGTHFPGVDGTSGGCDVRRAKAGVERPGHRRFHGIGSVGPFEAVTQHHGRRQDLSDGIGDALTRDVRGRCHLPARRVRNRSG
jgi:hypothetical protein